MIYITKKSVSRRKFLRGAGVAVSLPMLDAMVPALAQSQPAWPELRFAGVYWPNGAWPEQWHPDEAGRNFTFKPSMRALEPFRNELITVSGLRHSGDPGPHLGASCGWLNGTGAIGIQGEPIESEKTLDQFFVDRYAGETPLPSIELATEDMGTSVGSCDGYSCLYFNAMSWRSSTQPLPIEKNPRITFERMYGETGSTEQRLQRLRYKGSLLDAMTDDVAQFNKQLSASDSQMLSSYLENVREVEQRLQRVMNRTLENDFDVPDAPAGIPQSFPEHMELTYDLMHLAYQGDISRVQTFLTGHEASMRGYAFINVPEAHHSVSHHGDDSDMIDKYNRIVTWHTEQFSNFVQKMKDTPEGDGSLYDHTLFYFGSGMGNGNVHDKNHPPTVLLGGANGRMAGLGNRHIKAEEGTPTANFLIGLSELSGLEVEQIGPSTGKLSLLT